MISKAEPPVEVLLKLCQLYKVNDILSAFGYDGYNEDGSIKLNLKEQELIKKYRSLDPFGQETVTIAVGRESDRTEQIAALENHSFELLNAAHQKPRATSEDLQYDNDIMDDDGEWE